jgi:hypothetical protein
MFALALLLAAVGFIKKDPDDNKYKLNFGGFYLDISNLFGAEPLLIGASLLDASKTDGFNVFDVLEQTLSTTFENFFVTNVIESVRYNTGILDFASDKLFNVIGSFVPNFYKSIVRMTKSSKMKYSSGIVGDLEYLAYSAIPFLNWNKRIDPYTGALEVRYSDNWLINILNESGLFGGLKVKTNIPTDIETMVRDLGLDVGELKGDYDDVGQLNYGTLNVIYGQLNNDALRNFMNDGVAYEVTDAKDENKKVTLVYSKMTNEQRKQVVERIKRNNAKYAKIGTWIQEGHKYYTNSSERETLRKLGITDNVFLKTSKLDGFVK